MSGIIRAARPKKDYFDVRNEVARDSRLSYRARGILVRLLSNEDGFRMTADDLAREGKEGRVSVLTALRELRGAGYMRVVRSQDERGRWMTATYIYDTPQPTGVRKPDSGFPDAGSPDVGSSTANKNNQQDDQENNEQKYQKQHAAAKNNGKRRCARSSGIVTWIEDDITAAERLEAAYPAAEITTAVTALQAAGKQPVPGLVEQEIENARRRAPRRGAARNIAQLTHEVQASIRGEK